MERVHYDLITLSRRGRCKDKNVVILKNNNIEEGRYICKVNGYKEGKYGIYTRFVEPIYKMPSGCDESLTYFITDFLTMDEVFVNVYVARILAAFTKGNLSIPNVSKILARDLYFELQRFAYKMPLKKAWEFCRKNELSAILNEFRSMLGRELKEGKVGKCLYALANENIDMSVPFNIQFINDKQDCWHNEDLNKVRISVQFSNLEIIEETTLDKVIGGRCLNYLFYKNKKTTFVIKKENNFKRAISILGNEYVFRTDTLHKFFILT